MKMRLIGLAIATLAAAAGAQTSQSPEDPWFAPCKSGAAKCEPWERDWEPHAGYKLFWLGEDRSRIYLSEPPYKLVRGFPSVWVYSDSKLKRYAEQDRVSLYQIDCRNRSIRILQQRVIGSAYQPKGEGDWEYVSPESFGDALVGKICPAIGRGNSPTQGVKRRPG